MQPTPGPQTQIFSHAAKGLLGTAFCGTIFLSGVAELLWTRAGASGSAVWDEGHSARLRPASFATTYTFGMESVISDLAVGTRIVPEPSAVLRKLAFKTSHCPAVSMLLWQRLSASCSAWHWRSFLSSRWLREAARFRNAPRRGVLVGLRLLPFSSAWDSPCARNVGRASNSSAATRSRSSCVKAPSLRSGEGKVETVECEALIALNKDGVSGDNCRL
mmetsp:Transcript_57329/g.134399  ORF Transcript_57329/g.134399 Transcript_57329/m.134399 type:complete len:218 (-) Transcript_57329:1327-1980(-)